MVLASIGCELPAMQAMGVDNADAGDAVALVPPHRESAAGPKAWGSNVPDIFDSATRSRIMASVQSRNTGPELILRRALHGRGLRYKLHDSALPGRPDLVFPRFGAICFVHGCFWHRHEGCRRTTTPATNRTYWERKFAVNVRRDRSNRTALLEAGWRVGVIWECALRPKKRSEDGGIARKLSHPTLGK